MKQVIGLLLLFALLVILLPFASLLLPKDAAAPAKPIPVQSSSAVASATAPDAAASLPAPPSAGKESPLLILDSATGEVATVEMFDFVRGAVAAELPMSYSDEAIKAQAVAAHSYALAVKASNKGTDASLKGADFAASPSQRLGYVTDEMMQKMWGKSYDENAKRLTALVEQVKDVVIATNGKAALACYHAISAGVTQSSENVWGTAVPYLISVDSQLDLTSPDYTATMTFTPKEIKEALGTVIPNLSLDDKTPKDWFKNVDVSDTGYVNTVTLADDNTISGNKFRTALSLRSAAFAVGYADDVFTITTHGYGHGVGLSQFGANALALAGKTYADILLHYFPGTVIWNVADITP